MAQYGLFVLKVPLNPTNQPYETGSTALCDGEANSLIAITVGKILAVN